MGMVEGFRIQNFGVLKDVKIGRLWSDDNTTPPLKSLAVVIGKNGVGKSTLFDTFGFISDCLKFGLEEACDLKQRGGYEKIVSLGSREAIKVELYYRESKDERPITYELEIDVEKNGRPYVKVERLRQRRKGQQKGQPFMFLDLLKGKGKAWKGNSFEDEESEKVLVELTDARHLGIATLGALKEHPRIAAFREFLEGWYLCYFTPDAARSLPMAGPQKYLNMHGDNLGNVVQYMERENPELLRKILEKIAAKIPGINQISTKKTDDGRLLLKFNDKGFKDPFYAQKMSDGTLKYFAYMLLLEETSQRPFICIEEPENGLYHGILNSLAMEFRRHASEKKTKSQIFITTHSPNFVDALSPEDVWILEKEDNGFSKIRRASDDSLVNGLVEEGIPLGSLWYSDYLDMR